METLHGRDNFRRTILSGERIEGGLLRFFIFCHQGGKGRLRVGVVVAGRVGGAVKRNHLKRVMRESLRGGLKGCSCMIPAPMDCDVVAMFRVSRASSMTRPTPGTFTPDVGLLCRRLESMERRVQ